MQTKHLETLRAMLAATEDTDETEALAAAVALSEFATESAVLEEFEGEWTTVVELTEGYKHTDDKGIVHFADTVRLRRPSVADEWKREALAAEVTGMSNPGYAALEMALVAQVIVDWKGLPMPDLQKHLGLLSRVDGGRLIGAMNGLETYCEKMAALGKLERRQKSP